MRLTLFNKAITYLLLGSGKFLTSRALRGLNYVRLNN